MLHRVAALVLVAVLPLARASAVDVAIHSDGRRQTVEDPRQDSKGQWMVTIEGRRTALPARVVALVDEGGKETVLIRELNDTPKSPDHEAALRELVDPKNGLWTVAGERLAAGLSRTVADELVELAKSGKKEVRGRAVSALSWFPTRDTALAAARAVLAEKDLGARRAGALALYAVQEILARCDALELVQQGLADKDAGVRVVFAMLAPPDLAPAKDVLRKDGLASSDHHVRETAALELGRRGDPAGEKTLIAMLARKELPGIDDPLLNQRLLIEEQVAVCAVLGTFDTDTARAALKKALSSPHEDVKKAAEKALAAG